MSGAPYIFGNFVPDESVEDVFKDQHAWHWRKKRQGWVCLACKAFIVATLDPSYLAERFIERCLVTATRRKLQASIDPPAEPVSPMVGRYLYGAGGSGSAGWPGQRLGAGGSGAGGASGPCVRIRRNR